MERSAADYQASRLERISAALADTLKTTRAEHLDWHPPGVDGALGRSALDQAAEVISTNRNIIRLLKGDAIDGSGSDERPFSTLAEAIELVSSVGAELADVVRSLTSEALEARYQHKRGPIVGYTLMEMPYRNTAYHIGQINYIQTLYGDSEFHLPPTWL